MKVNLKITEKCSANCTCCESRKKTYKAAYADSENMLENFHLAKKIIEEMSSFNDSYLVISGGEPSEVENLDAVIRYAKVRGVKVKVNTNGWGVTEDWLNKMYDAGMNCVMLSFYSIDRLIYTRLRGSGLLYNRAIEAIKILKEFKRKHADLEVRLQTVIMKENFRGLPELLELAINSGFDALSTMYLCNVKSYPHLQLSREEIREFNNCVKPRLHEIVIKSGLNEVLKRNAIESINSFFKEDYKNSIDYSNGIYRLEGDCDCDLKNNFLAIYSNGDVVPCYYFDYVRTEEYIDNISDKSFRDIFSSRRYNLFWEKGRDFCKYCPDGKHVWIKLK